MPPLQFINSIELVKKDMQESRKLGDVVAMLKKMEAPWGQQELLAEPRSKWVVNDLKFTVRQE